MTLARTIADAALEKQAMDVVILDLRELDAVTDCFVICTGEVNQQVRAIAENIVKQVKSTTGDRLLHREGTDTLNWVILDYVNVVVHIFKPSFREFYRLENLWGDGKLIRVDDIAAVKPKAAKRAAKPTAAAPAKQAKPRVAKPATAKKTASRKPATRTKSTKKKS